MINTTQLVVQTDKTTIEWLENNGYENPHRLPDGYIFPVFIVDVPSKTIFGTNTTCMAAACSAGLKPIVLNFKELKNKITRLTGQ